MLLRRLHWFGIVLPMMVHASTYLKAAGAVPPSLALAWSQLAPLPVAEGYAGGFAGVSGGVLLFAGGANFPGRPPWEGGVKTWHDRIFVLESPDAAWRDAGVLPEVLAYGASVTTRRGLVGIGGCDATRHRPDVFALAWTQNRAVRSALPPLPRASAYGAAVAIEDRLYYAGGSDAPESTVASRAMWMLDLAAEKIAWRELPPCPGPGRLMPVMAVAGREIFLFGGYDLAADSRGKPQRRMLQDSWAFDPSRDRWRPLAPSPRPIVGVPSPALALSPHEIALFGWNDGSLAAQPPAGRADFPADLLRYDVRRDTWAKEAPLPFVQKVTPVVPWLDGVVIVSGEVQPGVRTPAVWFGRCTP